MKQNARAMCREGFALSLLSGHGNIFLLSALYIIHFDSILPFASVSIRLLMFLPFLHAISTYLLLQVVSYLQLKQNIKIAAVLVQFFI